ncbi:hypothetical protein EBR77_02705 [bacterium]|nr:hypothetical protein [bacterium]NBX78237.1 hypothetical protein [bacterium]
MKKLLLFLFAILSLHIIYCASAEDADNQPALHSRHAYDDVDTEDNLRFDYKSWQKDPHASISDDPIDRRSTCEILCTWLCPWFCKSETDILDEQEDIIIEIERKKD